MLPSGNSWQGLLAACLDADRTLQAFGRVKGAPRRGSKPPFLTPERPSLNRMDRGLSQAIGDCPLPGAPANGIP